MFTDKAKRVTTVFFAGMLFFANAASRPVHAQERSVSIRDALDSRLVDAFFCGIGASSGLAILMAIKSRVGDRLRVGVPGGTVLRNNNAGAQNMIVHRVKGKLDRELTQDIARECVEAAGREEKSQAPAANWLTANSITLGPYQSQLFFLSAYCLDFEKDNPGPGDGLTISGRADDETAQLFRFLERNPSSYGIAGIQLATWGIKGNLSATYIADKFSYTAEDRREACQLLSAAGINVNRKAFCSGN
jgi:hypothetical protein